MSKAVMLSIKPKYCDLIAGGKKRLEFRKTIPKQKPPFKCYIYCTKSNLHECLMQNAAGVQLIKCINYITAITCGGYVANGKVIGEFVCDYILRHCESSNADIAEQNGFVKRERIFEYSKGEEVKGLHISELKIYDKPKALNEFYKACNKAAFYDCSKCADKGEIVCYALERPPQSWCYVEEL